jgi:hypothetical protein
MVSPELNQTGMVPNESHGDRHGDYYALNRQKTSLIFLIDGTLFRTTFGKSETSLIASFSTLDLTLLLTKSAAKIRSGQKSAIFDSHLESVLGEFHHELE